MMERFYMIRHPENRIEKLPYYLYDIILRQITFNKKISISEFKSAFSYYTKALTIFSRMFFVGTNSIFPSEGKSIIINYDFWISQFPVTTYEFSTFCDQTNQKKPNSDPGYGTIIPFALYGVTHEQMKAYCNWLSKNDGFSPAYDDSGDLIDQKGEKTKYIEAVEGYRLPTFDEFFLLSLTKNYTLGEKINTWDYYYRKLETYKTPKLFKSFLRQKKINFFDEYEACQNKCFQKIYHRSWQAGSCMNSWWNYYPMEYTKIHTFDQRNMQSKNYLNYAGPENVKSTKNKSPELWLYEQQTKNIYFYVKPPFKDPQEKLENSIGIDLNDDQAVFRVARTSIQ